MPIKGGKSLTSALVERQGDKDKSGSYLNLKCMSAGFDRSDSVPGNRYETSDSVAFSLAPCLALCREPTALRRATPRGRRTARKMPSSRRAITSILRLLARPRIFLPGSTAFHCRQGSRFSHWNLKASHDSAMALS